jgi:hypothetical protein
MKFTSFRMEDAGKIKPADMQTRPGRIAQKKKKRQHDQGSIRTLHTPRFQFGHQGVYQPNLQYDYT